MESGHLGGQDMEDTVLVFMDVRSVKLLQKVNPKLMLGCTTTLMESGHPGGLDMVDTVLVFMGARSVKLPQKVNPMLTLGYTTTHMVYGQPVHRILYQWTCSLGTQEERSRSYL